MLSPSGGLFKADKRGARDPWKIETQISPMTIQKDFHHSW